MVINKYWMSRKLTWWQHEMKGQGNKVFTIHPSMNKKLIIDYSHYGKSQEIITVIIIYYRSSWGKYEYMKQLGIAINSILLNMLYCDPQMSTSWCCQKKNHGIIRVNRSDPLGVNLRSTLNSCDNWYVKKYFKEKEMHQQIILSPCTKGLSTADISKHRTIEDKIIQCPTRLW